MYKNNFSLKRRLKFASIMIDSFSWCLSRVSLSPEKRNKEAASDKSTENGQCADHSARRKREIKRTVKLHTCNI